MRACSGITEYLTMRFIVCLYSIERKHSYSQVFAQNHDLEYGAKIIAERTMREKVSLKCTKKGDIVF